MMDYKFFQLNGLWTVGEATVDIEMIRTSHPDRTWSIASVPTYFSTFVGLVPSNVIFGDDYYVRICDTTPAPWRSHPICALSPALSIDGVS